MHYVTMQVVHSIQADKLQEAEHHRLVQKALAGRQERSKISVQALVQLAQTLTARVQHIVPELAS